MTALSDEDKAYLSDRGYEYREVASDGQSGVVIKQRPLPESRFDSEDADILIILPPRYPMVPPDMFYLLPWVRLRANNAYPNAADQPFQFDGQKWQRWSRHEKDWRPGKDGIWTMLKRVQHALEVAA